MIQIFLKLSLIITVIYPTFLFAGTPLKIFSWTKHELLHIKESQVFNLIRKIYLSDLSESSLKKIASEVNQIFLFGDLDNYKFGEYNKHGYPLYILLRDSIRVLFTRNKGIKEQFLSLLRQEIKDYHSQLPAPNFFKLLLTKTLKPHHIYDLWADNLIHYEDIFDCYIRIKNFFYERNGKNFYEEIIKLQNDSPTKLSFFHQKELASLEVYDIFLDFSQDVRGVAHQLNHLFTTTNFLHSKYDLVYHKIFLILFKEYLSKLSDLDKIQLNSAIAYEISRSISLDNAFNSFLEAEMKSPQLSTLTYIDIYRSLIIPSEQMSASQHSKVQKNDYQFTQPRNLFHLHINDVLFSPEITPKDLVTHINRVFLNTDFHLNSSKYTSILKSQLLKYFNKLNKETQKYFLQLLAEEIEISIDLGPLFHRFIQSQVIDASFDLDIYLQIYEALMLSYHDEDTIKGYLETSDYKTVFMMQLYTEDFLPIHSILKEPVSSSNLKSLSQMLTYIFLHTTILLSSYYEDRFVFNTFLKPELLNYIKSLSGELKHEFYEFFIESLSEDSLFSEKMTNYLKSLYSYKDVEKSFTYSPILNFIRIFLEGSQHETLNGMEGMIPDLGKYFQNASIQFKP